MCMEGTPIESFLWSDIAERFLSGEKFRGSKHSPFCYKFGKGSLKQNHEKFVVWQLLTFDVRFGSFRLGELVLTVHTGDGCKVHLRLKAAPNSVGIFEGDVPFFPRWLMLC